MLLKERQFGGGAWNRSTNIAYKSSLSTSENELTIMDHYKNYSIMYMGTNNFNTVFWKRLLKRDENYLGADENKDESYWSIIGDHRRFIFVIAYKQNPMTHSRILGFGDFTDPKDNTLKTMLFGYNSNQIADVGFNKIFEYFDFTFNNKGILEMNSLSNQPSGIGWIHSNRNGEVSYLHGTKDCGQHQYPIPLS